MSRLSSSDIDITQAMADAIAGWTRLTSMSAGGRVEEWNGVWMCDFNSSHPYRNAAVPTRQLLPAEALELIERLQEFYQRDSGWVVTSAFDLPIEDKRLHYSESEPIMVLDDPDTFSARAVPGLSIVDVTDGDDVLRFERLRAEMYPVPHLYGADEKELWTGEILNGGIQLFIGYIDGVPVATGGSWETSQINEITSLSTRRSHRHRGIARAMMRYAIDKSDRPPVLFSLAIAQGAYERMGFRTVGDVRYWVPTAFEANYPGGWDASPACL